MTIAALAKRPDKAKWENMSQYERSLFLRDLYIKYREGENSRLGKELMDRISDMACADRYAVERGGPTYYQPWMTPTQYVWRLIEATAENQAIFTRAKRKDCRRVLVLVKAQHPLNPDGTPREEYRARLNRALEVSRRIESEGRQAVIMTVGGVHEGNSEVSLAKAGENYLRKEGFSGKILVREKIFSGNDEDFVCLEYFNSHQEYADLYVCCSAGQYMRSYMCGLVYNYVPVHEIVHVPSPHQHTVLELMGDWSVGGMLKDGPLAIFEAAAETAERHKREAAEAAGK